MLLLIFLEKCITRNPSQFPEDKESILKKSASWLHNLNWFDYFLILFYNCFQLTN